jgi:hypothetical protein
VPEEAVSWQQWLTTHVSDTEAQALSDFLVEVLLLENQVTDALCRYYVRSDRRAEFTEQFLNRMTLGRAIKNLRPVLDAFNVGPNERELFNEVVAVRNLVAHQLPTTYWEDVDDEDSFYSAYDRKAQVLRVDDLDTCRVMTLKLRALLHRFNWQSLDACDAVPAPTSRS